MTWPEPVEPPSLSSIIDAGSMVLDSYEDYPLPKTTVARKNLQEAIARVQLEAKKKQVAPTSLEVVEGASVCCDRGCDPGAIRAPRPIRHRPRPRPQPRPNAGRSPRNTGHPNHAISTPPPLQ